MRFSYERQRCGTWYPWFVWHPVRLDNGLVAWWETVYRKYHFLGIGRPSPVLIAHYRGLEEGF